MVEARKATFGGKWPYESKKGFKCKTKQVSTLAFRLGNEKNRQALTGLVACRSRMEIHPNSGVRRHGNMHVLPASPGWLGIR